MQKIRAGIVQDPQQEREREQEQERGRERQERVRELEKIITEKDENLVKANQTIQRLSGEIEHLNEQLIFEKKKNSSQVKTNGTNYSNIPKQVKEIFKNDKIPVFKRYENQPSELLNEFKNNKESTSMITQHLEDLMIKGKISIGCSDCLLWPDVTRNTTKIFCNEQNSHDHTKKRLVVEGSRTRMKYDTNLSKFKQKGKI